MNFPILLGLLDPHRDTGAIYSICSIFGCFSVFCECWDEFLLRQQRILCFWWIDQQGITFSYQIIYSYLWRENLTKIDKEYIYFYICTEFRILSLRNALHMTTIALHFVSSLDICLNKIQKYANTANNINNDDNVFLAIMIFSSYKSYYLTCS